MRNEKCHVENFVVREQGANGNAQNAHSVTPPPSRRIP